MSATVHDSDIGRIRAEKTSLGSCRKNLLALKRIGFVRDKRENTFFCDIGNHIFRAGTENSVNVRDFFDYFTAQLLSDTAHYENSRSFRFFLRQITACAAVKFEQRLFAYAAAVDYDKLCLFRIFGIFPAFFGKHYGNTLAVVNVHLTAESMNEKFLHDSSKKQKKTGENPRFKSNRTSGYGTA